MTWNTRWKALFVQLRALRLLPFSSPYVMYISANSSNMSCHVKEISDFLGRKERYSLQISAEINNFSAFMPTKDLNSRIEVLVPATGLIFIAFKSIEGFWLYCGRSH
ncbi:hypothetical protein TNCT_97471 [Trichonephila clavata]|uniref:Uncharacterized protein n=1 Tax=Trichonephila clavata TaxID=2740835 RepID=A0A8X6I100_TRICU|nr:hypothetical protein TNCT_97471 [Trichonephila clavata]